MTSHKATSLPHPEATKMTGTQDFVGKPFLADIQVPAILCGEIIKGRFPCHRRTHVLPNQLTPCTFEDREQY